MSIDTIALWFARAVPNPSQKNLDVQNGVHAEEFGEYLAALSGNTEASEQALRKLQAAVEQFATALKTGSISVKVSNPKEALDAICDQIVTATGCGHMLGMKVAEGLRRVDQSNWSKFDSNGQPIFNEHGKIAKSSNYKEADFTGCY